MKIDRFGSIVVSALRATIYSGGNLRAGWGRGGSCVRVVATWGERYQADFTILSQKVLYFYTGNGHNCPIEHCWRPVHRVTGDGCPWTFERNRGEVVGEEGMRKVADSRAWGELVSRVRVVHTTGRRERLCRQATDRGSGGPLLFFPHRPGYSPSGQ